MVENAPARCLLGIAGIVGMAATANGHDYFAIHVVDDVTGRGVPLVELATVNNIRLVTDSAGVVAFDEPGLMNRKVFFHVSSHGYEFPQDGFGFRGTSLQVKPGGTATLKIKRVNLAERLYRVTGAGIYRDSLLVGRPVPIEQPVLNGQVLGSDSVVNAVHNGKIHWFWGDTHRPSYPLGNFHVPGAVSRLPGRGGLDPEVGVDLQYFVDEGGFAKPTAKLPGDGPTWIGGLVSLADDNGPDQLFASYVKIQPPLTVYARGLAKFNDETKTFQKVAEFDMDSPLFPAGHPFIHQQGGIKYVYFANPFPVIRVRATAADLRDLSSYQAYTCLTKGDEGDLVERDAGGKPQFGWKTDAIPFTQERQTQLIAAGQLDPADRLYQLVDDAGKQLRIHRGSVNWNPYRQKWILIGVQSMGTSFLGEVWYAEAEQPVGPWVNARKIASHQDYSFYNPKQHPMWDKQGGRVIFFEGTYTNMFSGNKDQTPRYNYNQILYKLDLSEPRLALPTMSR
jgi:hypothetical protein